MSTPRSNPRAKYGSATVLMLAAALAGCAASPPAAERTPTSALPAVQVPAAWQAPLPAAGATVAAASTTSTTSAASPAATAVPAATETSPVRRGPAAWWAAFDDSLLPALIEAAQRASPSLSAAAARIEAARAARVATGAALQPQFDATGAVVRSRSVPGGPATGSASLGVQAGWELDLFGARGAAREASTLRLEAAEVQWHAANVALAAEVGSTYVSLRACEAQVDQATLDADSRAQTARLTEQSAQSGMVAPANAALARASAAQGRAQLAEQRAACEALVKSLVALTALDEPALRQRLAAATARQPQPPGRAVASLPATLLEQRPDLVAAARQVQAAAADRQQARADRLPRVSLLGSIGLMHIATSGGAGSQDGSTWSIGPLAVSLPLFDGGRRAAQESAARAAYDDAVVQWQAALRGAVREVEEALVALATVAAREADIGIATEGFEASLRAAEARWRGGVGSLYELEDARRTALAAKSALVDLKRERATAWINLYRALGGGWSPGDAAASPR